MKKLANKVAVVTGGNSGIGLATAQELIEQGATVVITGRNRDAVEAAAQEIGAIGLVANKANVSEIEQLRSDIENRVGQIDFLFINAGVGFLAPIDHLSEAQFDEMMDVNFKGAFFTLQKLLPILKDGANVVFLSSVNALAAMPNTSIYGASKAAMNALARVAATELAPRGIRVNMVSPGPVSTPFFGKTGLPQEAIQNFAVAMQNRVPLKRFGASEEVAKLVAFLASEDAAYITGSEFVIDGGVSLNSVLG
jgi:NAD(P)-dependent dehydrogenase (short-subunit alcohol dehydrogenase family)